MPSIRKSVYIYIYSLLHLPFINLLQIVWSIWLQDLALGLLQPSDRRLTWPSLRQHCWWCGEPLGADNDVARRGEVRPDTVSLHFAYIHLF